MMECGRVIDTSPSVNRSRIPISASDVVLVIEQNVYVRLAHACISAERVRDTVTVA